VLHFFNTSELGVRQLTLTAIKCIKQPYEPTEKILAMMETFRRMVNDCLRIGLENDASTLKKLSKLCYPTLARHDIISYYKLHAISKAAGILSNRKQSIKRGYHTKAPYMKRASLVSSYGFKIENGTPDSTWRQAIL
jgi:putative transposase